MPTGLSVGNTLALFTPAMTVGRIGPYASNRSVFPPAYVSQVDHFRVIVPDVGDTKPVTP